MPYQLNPPPMNPLSRLLAGVLAALAVVGAVFFGIFVLAMVVGLGLMAWLALWLRMWWLGRKMRGAGIRAGQAARDRGQAGAPEGRRSGEVIDAEYTVVSRQDEE